MIGTCAARRRYCSQEMDSLSVGSIRRSACLSFPAPGAACAQFGEASWGQAGPDPESWAGMCDVSSSFPPIPRAAFTHRDQDPLEDKDRAVWRGRVAARCPLRPPPHGTGSSHHPAQVPAAARLGSASPPPPGRADVELPWRKAHQGTTPHP